MTAGSAYEAYEAAGELLRALAAPLRIAIVTELRAGPRCVHELVDLLQAPQPLVSQHLRVLRGAGVVRGQRRGREIAYSLTDDHIAHIVADAVSHAREAPDTDPNADSHMDPGSVRPAHPTRPVLDTNRGSRTSDKAVMTGTLAPSGSTATGKKEH